MPLGVFVHSMNKLMYESVSPYVCALLYCVCMWLAGLINRQWVGRWKESTASDYWHNPGRTQRWALQEIWLVGLSAAIWSPPSNIQRRKNAQKQAARDTALSILMPLLVLFSSYCVTVNFKDCFSPVCLLVSLSVSCCLALNHSPCLCLRTACYEMLRPCAGLKVWGLGLEVWTTVPALCLLSCLCVWKCVFDFFWTGLCCTAATGVTVQADDSLRYWMNILFFTNLSLRLRSHLICWAYYSQMGVHSLQMTDQLFCSCTAFMSWVCTTIDFNKLNFYLPSLLS